MESISEEKRLSILHDLDRQGYVVIPDVISASQCDELAQKFKDWIGQFEYGDFPKNRRSVIHGYGVAHMEPTWRIRLKAKPVFQAIYGTTKLLSSMDGVGLLSPAATNGDFDTGIFWFHCDQSCTKLGHHSLQGAVYLEETLPEDYCFRVLKGSHRKHQEFFNDAKHKRAKRKSESKEFCKLTKAEIKWYTDQGCEVTTVGVPKGGMVLWDSRTIHDTKRPTKNRKNQDRWRMLTFVSMAPAAWASPRDLSKKKEAYKGMETTAHWASQGVTILRFMGEGTHSNAEAVRLRERPAIASTREVQLLAGLKPYDLKDGKPNGPPLPKMRDEVETTDGDNKSLLSFFPADQSNTNAPSESMLLDSVEDVPTDQSLISHNDELDCQTMDVDENHCPHNPKKRKTTK